MLHLALSKVVDPPRLPMDVLASQFSVSCIIARGQTFLLTLQSQVSHSARQVSQNAFQWIERSPAVGGPKSLPLLTLQMLFFIKSFMVEIIPVASHRNRIPRSSNLEGLADLTV